MALDRDKSQWIAMVRTGAVRWRYVCLMTDKPPDDGWTSYAPLDAAPAACSFCGEPNRHDGRLLASGDGSVAICEECVSKFAAFFERRRA